MAGGVPAASQALAGSSIDDRPGTDDECTLITSTASCDSTDQAASQQLYTMSLGMDF